jgi:hypothetical protein
LPPEEVIPKGSPQAVFVPMSWIKKFRLTFTPTFVVFGPSGRLLWTHQGTLAPDDMEAALEAVKSARRARQ